MRLCWVVLILGDRDVLAVLPADIVSSLVMGSSNLGGDKNGWLCT